jgi:hypothetical protein
LNHETVVFEFAGNTGSTLRLYLGERNHDGGQPLFPNDATLTVEPVAIAEPNAGATRA